MDRFCSKDKEDLQLINAICNINNSENLTSLIQKKLLSALGATVWIWYWQGSKNSSLEIISIVMTSIVYSMSNEHLLSTNIIGEKLNTENVSLLFCNKSFDSQDKVALLSLLKQKSLFTGKNFFNTRYTAMIQKPGLIRFAVIGTGDFIPKNYQLMDMIAPIMLLQKRNIIRSKIIKHYRVMLNELSEENCMTLLDQTYQVMGCTNSFNELFSEDYVQFNEVISVIQGFTNSMECQNELKSEDNFKSVSRFGRRAYEVSIKAVDFDDSERQCFWLVSLNRLFNENDKGLRKLREAGLTNREIEICAYVCLGLTNEGIANRLNISFFTVKNHIKHVFLKLNMSSRQDLSKYLACKDGQVSEELAN